jgi:uncharacterized protein
MKYFAILLITLIACANPKTESKMNVLVIAGGHSFDTLAFYSVFDEMQGLTIETAIQPEANRIIASADADKYDVIVFYDSWQNITEDQQQGYLRLLEKGTGMVFLHHALVSYQNWPEFTEIIGGKYKQPRFDGDTTDLSDYKHDIWLQVATNPDHPITKGIEDFDIFDEGYMNLDVLPGVTTLLTTQHEFSHDIIGWAHTVNNSRVVYLLPGHAKEGLHNPRYLEIIENAIHWTGNRK